MFCILEGDLNLSKISCMDDRHNHELLQYISHTEYQDVCSAVRAITNSLAIVKPYLSVEMLPFVLQNVMKLSFFHGRHIR